MPIVSFSFLVSGQREGTVFLKEVTLQPRLTLSKPSCRVLRKANLAPCYHLSFGGVRVCVCMCVVYLFVYFVLFSDFVYFDKEFSSSGWIRLRYV